MPDARTQRVQGLRRSGAAGPHGKGRREAPDIAQALADEVDEHPADKQTADDAWWVGRP